MGPSTGTNAITEAADTNRSCEGVRPADNKKPVALAARLGVQYLTRSGNRHAKAGNLNAALARTQGEFIAVLDADMVPQPDYLDKTLGYFVDERVALVQLPQESYNLDSMQHTRRLKESGVWHDQSLFFLMWNMGVRTP